MRPLSGIIILFLISLSGISNARTWNIKPDSTGDAPTIQAGIDSSVAGDTVLVAEGTYSNTRQVLIDSELKIINIHLRKNIVLIAKGLQTNTIIDGSASDIAIYVNNIDSFGKICGFQISTSCIGWSCLLTSFSLMNNTNPIGIKCKESSIYITNNDICD